MGRSKFNVDYNKDDKTFNGIVFDSCYEMRYYIEVVLPGLENGSIIHCELQKAYELQPKFKHDGKSYSSVSYIADYVITYANGSVEVIDVKGNIDAVFSLKKKLLLFHYPDMNFRCVSYSKIDGGWVDREYIMKQRKIRKKEKLEKKEKDGIK